MLLVYRQKPADCTEIWMAKLKNYVLETFRVIEYHDKQLIVFDVVYQDEISLYSGMKYVRHGNETVRVKV